MNFIFSVVELSIGWGRIRGRDGEFEMIYWGGRGFVWVWGGGSDSKGLYFGDIL